MSENSSETNTFETRNTQLTHLGLSLLSPKHLYRTLPHNELDTSLLRIEFEKHSS